MGPGCLLALGLAVGLGLPGSAAQSGEGCTVFVQSVDGEDGLRAGLAKSRALAKTTRCSSYRTLQLGAGRFQLSAPLQLDSRDSGLSVLGAGRNLTFLSGGVVLPTKGWVKTARGGVWMLKLPAAPRGTSWRSRSLFVNGSRATRARHPNGPGGYAIIRAPIEPSSSGFIYDPADFLPAGTQLTPFDLSSVEIVVFASWQASRRRIRSISSHNATLLFDTPASVQFTYANTGRRYYTENYLAAVDEPFEWFLDPQDSGYLYFVPPPGKTPPECGTFVAAIVAGDLVSITDAANIIVANLTIEHADWGADWDRVAKMSGTVQAASFLNTSAVRISASTDVSLISINVQRCGEYGVWLHNGTVKTLISDVIVSDTGAGGVRIGEGKPLSDAPDGTANNTLVDSTVVRGSAVFPEGNGVLVQKSSYNIIQRCEVAYFGHCGISVGWTWDYVKTEAHHNAVIDNHVHHLGNALLTDLAGIYLLGVSPGTRVERNYIHDIYPFYKYGHGIYLDQASSDILIKNNWVARTEAANFLLHYGLNNSITANVFAFATGGFGNVWQSADPGWPTVGVQSRASMLNFTHNIVYVSTLGRKPDSFIDASADTGFPLFQSPYRGNSTFNGNTYFNASGPLTHTFPGWNADGKCSIESTNRSFTQWQSSGQDQDSVAGRDPLFVDALADDFRLQPDSPVRSIPGYTPFELLAPGPSVSHIWRPSCLNADGSTFLSCPPYPPPTHGFVSGPADTLCGTSVRIACRQGFKQIGIRSATCSNGGWSTGKAACVPIPPHPAVLSSPGFITASNFMLARNNSNGMSAVLVTTDCGALALFNGTDPRVAARGGVPLWSSFGSKRPQNCSSTLPYFAAIQSDGNLCVYPGRPPSHANRLFTGASVWCSGSNSATGMYFLQVLSKGGLAVHRGYEPGPGTDGGIIWSRGALAHDRGGAVV